MDLVNSFLRWVSTYLIMTIIVYGIYFIINAITAKFFGKVLPNFKHFIDKEDKPEPILSFFIGFLTVISYYYAIEYFSWSSSNLSISFFFLPVIVRFFSKQAGRANLFFLIGTIIGIIVEIFTSNITLW